MEYPVNLSISYSDDNEYRQCIRTLLYDSSANEESYEIDFDKTPPLFDMVFAKTHHIQIFKELYLKAAALVISEDMSIGLTILFSYDYLEMFHKILCSFFRNGEMLVEPMGAEDENEKNPESSGVDAVHKTLEHLNLKLI
jgi:hypothetical protein